MMRLSSVPEAEVAYVTDERTCQSVLGEYNEYSGTRDAETGVASPPSEQVCVVKVGTAYVVNDPTKTYGEFTIFVTVDAAFRMLSHVLG
jgi:hypothetical protein